MLLIAAAATRVDAFDGPRTATLAVLAALGVSYAVLGAPALSGDHPWRAIGYLLTLVVVLGLLSLWASQLLFLLFLAYPQVWFLVEGVRPGVFWTVLLALASSAGPVVEVVRGEQPVSGVVDSAVGLTFSIALGVWISRVLAQSRERASLIEQLESTRAELATAHREQGVVAERERLAREVHDTLAQGYTSIVVLAQTAAVQVDRDPAGARERLALIEEVARENLAEARAMVAAFSPVALDGSTLVEALQRLADRFGRETGTSVRVDAVALGDGAVLRRDEEIVLLRGAQEALTNVRRHAAASAVVVRLSRVRGVVSVHVEDDGVGFDPSRAHGAGLTGLRDRVGQVGGSVEVASAPGEGTRVTVRVSGA
ncbi:sensor histidine kinase [Modestobacter sp. I12A-02628]|uniref:Oxygen sensor histidine kinase NreB n=2 Tax=Goekera deserti TaxID=2497753 RepID=A0A7K3WCR4_9ACTN|nr:sensor histidine kinase [Goekera deserti]NDI49042.1 sensor histidine kinase [Goekera deserti]NEL54167.1 sensor histidine kinase [Goekera deserti]